MKSRLSTLWGAVIVCLLSAGPSGLARVGAATPGDDFVVHRNIDYVASADYEKDKDKLDLFMPAGATNVPVVVFFHGGGLMRGDKADHGFIASRLVPEGIGVVLANYRLSPDVMHPAHIEDAAAAFAWVVEHIDEYGGDPRRIFVSGHSAGAYLAALLSLDPRYLKAHGLGLKDIRGSMPISAFLYVEETAIERDKSVWGTDPKEWKQASVSPYIAADKPPLLLIYADGDDDWRKRHNETLAAALKKSANTDVEAVQVHDRTHMTVWRAIDQANDPTGERIIAFVKRH